MARLQHLPPEILGRIFQFIGSRPATTTLVPSKTSDSTTLPLIPMQNLILASLVSPTLHAFAYNAFLNIYRTTNPDCQTNVVFWIWQERIRCLLQRSEWWSRNRKLVGGCRCHGKDATWITGWDEIVRIIGKEDPGLVFWRDWIRHNDTVRKGKLKTKGENCGGNKRSVNMFEAWKQYGI